MITVKMDYSYIVPKEGSDRTGHLTTKNGEILLLHNGSHGCVCMMM
jgi:hypothetical protein